MMSNRFAHFVEIISQRGADYEIDGTVITDEFKELNQFIQEEKQRITQAFLNPGTLNRWKKMKQAIETPHDL